MLQQAIEAGDLAAARSAAMHLWQGGDRRFDAQLVLLVDAMRRSDWKAAETYIPGSGDKTGGGGQGTNNDVAILWSPGRRPILLTTYLTGTAATLDVRNAALASVGRAVAAAVA